MQDLVEDSKRIKVGENDYSTRYVTELNHELFTNARKIINTKGDLAGHGLGWRGIGDFIDWLEENYTITSKNDK